MSKALNIGDIVYIKNSSSALYKNCFALITSTSSDEYEVNNCAGYKRDDLKLIKRNLNVELMQYLSDVNADIKELRNAQLRQLD